MEFNWLMFVVPFLILEGQYVGHPVLFFVYGFLSTCQLSESVRQRATSY